jgi:hypothetical protein
MLPLPAAVASVSLRITCKWRSCPAGAGRGAFSRGYLSSIDQAARSPFFAKATILIFSHFASWRERYLRKMRLPPKRNVRIASAKRAWPPRALASTETRLPPRTPGPLTRRPVGGALSCHSTPSGNLMPSHADVRRVSGGVTVAANLPQLDAKCWSPAHRPGAGSPALGVKLKRTRSISAGPVAHRSAIAFISAWRPDSGRNAAAAAESRRSAGGRPAAPSAGSEAAAALRLDVDVEALDVGQRRAEVGLGRVRDAVAPAATAAAG